VIILCLACFFPGCNNRNIIKYKDPALPLETRVEDLLSRMTLEEKVLQLQGSGTDELASLNIEEVGDQTKKIIRSGIGWIHNNTKSLEDYVTWINNTQRNLMEKSRLGIPALVIAEGLHGLMSYEGTVFPSCIALGGTFDTLLIRDIYSTVSEEARSRGTNLFLSPVVDVGREPRWGRQEETFGEDPYLVKKISLAATLGFQGGDLLLPENKALVTLKHFAGHAVPEAGSYAGPLQADDRTFHEVHLAPYREIIERLEPGSVMATYHSVNGVPMCINKALLTDLLKNEWGYKSSVMSDGGAIPQLFQVHNVAKDTIDATLRSFLAGVDMELGGGCYKFIEDLVNQGLITQERLNDAVRRMLRMKFRLGLFENPYADPEDAIRKTHSQEAQELSRIAAEKSIVLLKNVNDILPLDKNRRQKIAVIGPMADRIDYGAYSIARHKGITPLEGIREKAGNNINILYAKGCLLTYKEDLDWFRHVNNDVKLVADEENNPLIREAVDVAGKSDIILLFIGEYDFMAGETWNNHFKDKSNLNLLGSQSKLLDALYKTGKPIISLQFTSGARSYVDVAEKASAILQCWYLGERGGEAVANILFGLVNPGAKLSVSVPRSAGHLPVYYSYLPIARRGYISDDISPLFPFGFGLSYTSFKYTNIHLSEDTIPYKGSTILKVDVTNTGKVAGDEIVQMYIRDILASITRPVKELKGFARISLAPGETKTVNFSITPKELEYYDLNNKFSVEPGEFEIMVGGSSVDTKSILLTVVK